MVVHKVENEWSQLRNAKIGDLVFFGWGLNESTTEMQRNAESPRVFSTNTVVGTFVLYRFENKKGCNRPPALLCFKLIRFAASTLDVNQSMHAKIQIQIIEKCGICKNNV